MTLNLIIRPEGKRDYKPVSEVHKLAFGGDAESRLVEKIRRGKNYIPDLSLVAEVDGEIVGHILLSKITIKGDSDYDSLALAPVGVIPGFQKRGVGAELIKHGIRKAKEMGFGSITVVGHSDYYPRFGFQRASKWGLKSPFEVPEEAFMAIELCENALRGKAGTLEYGAEFAECL